MSRSRNTTTARGGAPESNYFHATVVVAILVVAAAAGVSTTVAQCEDGTPGQVRVCACVRVHPRAGVCVRVCVRAVRRVALDHTLGTC